MAKKVLTGTIVSDKMTNTVVVEVVRHTVHPLYKKRMKVTKKYSADTNNIVSALGDLVKIEETKPMSKTKHFKVIEKIVKITPEGEKTTQAKTATTDVAKKKVKAPVKKTQAKKEEAK